MKLSDFNVGDKVCLDQPDALPHIFSEILFIGQQNVLLRNWRGTEFLRERSAKGFKKWHPLPTYDELKNRYEHLLVLGADLVSAIEKADSSVLKNKTWHMHSAITNWEYEVSRV